MSFQKTHFNSKSLMKGGKKLLSVFMSVMMLMTAWVFVAPEKAEAAENTYYWRVRVNSSNNTGGWDTYKWTVYGKPNNGTGSESSISTFNCKIDFKEDGKIVGSGSSSSFPSKVTFQYSFGGGVTHRKMDATAFLDVSSDNSNWTNIGSETFYSYEWGTNSGTKTITAGSYPYVSSSLSITGATTPICSATTSETLSIDFSSAVDQYGVKWVVYPTWSSNNTSIATVGTKTDSSYSSSCPITMKTTSGTVTITASFAGGSTKTFTKQITYYYRHNLTTTAAVEPTCTTGGNYVYYTCSICGGVFSDSAGTTSTTVAARQRSALGHSYTGDYVNKSTGIHYRKCTRFSACGTYGLGTTQNSTEACTAASTYTSDTTQHWKLCTKCSGLAIAKANHSGGTATCIASAVCQTCGTSYGSINASNHDWQAPTYAWSDDGHSITATRVCNRNSSHIETETATIANGKITSAEHIAATCTTMGTTRYTATFTNSAFAQQTKDVQDIPLNLNNHPYGEPTYTWSTDGKTCTATRICSENSSHSESETATIDNGKVTGEQTADPSCTENGETTYTATFDNTAFTTQTTVKSDVAALGHSPVEIPANAPTCLATGNNRYYQCSRCNKYFTTYACTTETTVAAQTIAQLDHSYTGAVRDNGDGTHSFKCVNGCNEYGGTVSCEATYGDWSNTTAPTCIVDGEDSRTCSVCGHVDTRVAGQLGHSFTVQMPTSEYLATAANCVDKATYYYKCSRCSEKGSETYEYGEVNPANHKSTESRAKVDPTCTDGGFTAGVYCTACNTWVSGHEVIPATGHDFTGTIHSLNNGTHNWACKNGCGAYGKVENGVQIPDGTVSCSYTETISKQPTCTDKGETTYTCDACGYSHTEEDIDALGHDWGTPSYSWAKDGSDWKCTATRVCGRDSTHIETETVTATSAVKTPETCEEDGWTTYTAAFENTAFEPQTKDEQDIAALGHDWANATYIWEVEGDTFYCRATKVCNNDSSHVVTERVEAVREVISGDCQTGGEIRYTATFTGEGFSTQSRSETLPGAGHKPTAHDFSDATCTEAGNKQYYECINCHKLFSDVECTNEVTAEWTVIPAKGHSEAEAVEENRVEATCTVDGSYESVVYCSRCGIELSRTTETIAKLGHNYVDVVTAPTCTAQGFTTHTCSRCGDIIVDTFTDPIGHDWNDGSVTTPATCTEDGLMTYTCRRAGCGATKTESIHAIGHDWGAWTDNNEGTHIRTCANDSSHTEVRAHSYIDVVDPDALVDPDADTCAAGVSYYKTCSVCGRISNSETFTTQQSGHKLVAVPAKDATCTEAGHGAYWQCAVCDKYFSDANAENEIAAPVTIAALGHQFDTSATPIEGNGGHMYKCLRCNGYGFGTELGAVEAHTFDQQNRGNRYIAGMATDCGMTATYYYSCKCGACGTATFSDESGTINHNLTAHPAVAATCKDEGRIAYWDCSRCHRLFSDENATTEIQADQLSVPKTDNHSFGEWTTVTAVTCTAKGSEKRVCSVCGKVELRETEALGHDFENGDVFRTNNDGTHNVKCAHCDVYDTVAVNCTNTTSTSTAGDCSHKGTTTYTCADCGGSWTVEGAVGNHDTTLVPAVAASCTEAGTLAYYKCSICNKIFADAAGSNEYTTASQLVVQPLGHELTAVEAVAATCVDGGHNTYYTCSRCGGNFRDNLGRYEMESVDEANTESLGHDWGEWTVVSAAGCETAGTKSRECARCHIVETETIPATGHDWGDWSVTTAATCTENGVETRVCANDETHTETRPIDAIGHSWGAWSDNGNEETHVRTCANDANHTETAAHSWIELVHADALVDPEADTCVDGVEYYKTCSVCGHISNSEKFTTQQAGHKLVAIPAKVATCTEAGNSAYWKCAVCGKFFSDANAQAEIAENSWVINALNHDFDESATPVEVEGGHMYKCTRCDGYGYNNTLGAVEPHTFDQQNRGNRYIAGMATDCGTTATYYYSCKCGACGTATFSDESGTINHNLTAHPAVAATCKDEGRVAYWECSRCHRLFSDENGTTEIHADQLSIPKTDNHSFGEWEVVTAATCTAKGSEKRVCSVCGKVELRETEALGHSFTGTSYKTFNNGTHSVKCIHCDVYGETVNCTNTTSTSTAGDCSHKGTTTYTCDDCGGKWTREDDFGTHSTTKVDAVAASCTEAGRREYYKCSVCGKMFADAAGNTEYASLDDLKVNALGHQLTLTPAANPTCTDDGNIAYYTCSVCNKIFKDENGRYELTDLSEAVIPATGHAYGEATYVWADDNSSVTASRICANDPAHVETETVSTTSEVINPSCLNDGKTVYTATFTNEAFAAQTKEVPISQSGHSWGEPTYVWADDGSTITAKRICSADATHIETETLTVGNGIAKVHSDPNCTADGSDVFTATFTNAAFAQQTKTIDLEKLGHDYDAVVTDPTCTEDGFTTHTCSRCGNTYTDSETEALGHDYVAVITAPTCTAQGFTTYICSRCGDSYIDDYVNETGHTSANPVRENVVEATCTEDGSYDNVVYCSVCGAQLSRETVTVDALGHSWDKGVVTTQATCTADGVKTFTCSRCNETYTETIPATSHDWNDWTADENGHSRTCKNDSSHVEVAEHTWANIPNADHMKSGVTCTETAVYYQSCSVCGYFSSDDAHTFTYGAADGHKLVTIPAQDPTCTENGNSEYYTCAVCGKFFSDENAENEIALNSWVIASLGHDFDENGTPIEAENGHMYHCSRCAAVGYDGVENNVQPHTFDQEVVAEKYLAGTAVNCGDTTTYYRSCKCGAKGEETFNGGGTLGHVLHKVDAKAATCAEDGNEDYWYCSRCNQYFSDENGATVTTLEAVTISKSTVSHTWGEWTTLTEATCTEKGSETRTCSVCGKVETQTTDALGHSFTSGTYRTYNDHTHSEKCERCDVYSEPVACSKTIIASTAADCSHTGTTTYKCDVCGGEWTVEGDIGPHIMAHHYEAVDATCVKDGRVEYWECSVCGKMFPDENGNGTPYADVDALTVPTLGHQMTKHNANEATCTEAGNIEYYTCSRCNKFFSDAFGNYALENEVATVIPATGHDYGEVSYVWADDNGSVTASRTCANDPTHIETETVSVTSEVSKNATCEAKGSTTYTSAEFENAAFKVQTKTIEDIEALGHDWKYGEAVFNWAGYGCANATVTCGNDGTHTKTVATTITSETTQSTCMTDGSTVYTAKFTADGTEYTDSKTEILTAPGHKNSSVVVENRVEATCETAGSYDEVVYCTVCGAELSRTTVEIPATGHAYGEVTYTWASDNSTVTAARTCANDPAHVESETVNVNAEITKAATCEAKGETTYTSLAFENSAFVIQTKTVEDIDALGHDWGDATYTWTGNGRKVVAQVVCGNDASHKITEEATVDNGKIVAAVEEEATCEEMGKTTYTATFDNTEFFESKSLTKEDIPALGHSYKFTEWEWADDFTSAEAIFTCERDSAHIHEETATVVSTPISATCEEGGRVSYTATVTFEGNKFTDTRETTSEALGHDWDYEHATFNWDGYACGTATVNCLNDAAHKLTVATTVSKVNTPATCETDGSNVYTASFEADGETYSSAPVTEVLAAFGHEYEFVDFTWNGTESAVANFKCANDASHTATAEATITSETIDATCEADGKTVYTATVSFEGETYADTVEVKIDKLNHDWDYENAVFNWVNYGCLNATVTCKNDPEHKLTVETIVTSETTNPSCTEPGKTVYTAAFAVNGVTYSDTAEQPLAQTGHNYKFKSWTWADDFSSATANFECATDNAHKTAVDATVTSVRTEPTCEEDGKIVYTAVAMFDGNAFTDVKEEKINKLGHDWDYDNAIFNWDGYNCGTATVTCKNDNTHKLTVAATISRVSTPATCTTEGSTVYTAKFTVDGIDYTDSRTETLSALGHSYSLTGWSWADDYSSATATFTCANDGSHIETVVDSDIDVSTVEAVCVDGGKTTYTAEVTFEGKNYKDVREETSDALGHNWNNPEWNWANDKSTATAKFVCARCGAVEILNADITSVVTPDTCLAAGKTVFTGTVTHAGEEFIDDQTVAGVKLDHSYTGEARDNGDGTHSFKCVNGCGEYGGTVDCVYGEWTVDVAATCLETGIDKRVCEVCGHSETRVSAALGHTDVDPHDGYCDRCGICVCDHKNTVIVNVAPATCISDGYTGDRVCALCGKLFTKGQAISHKGNEHVTGAPEIRVVNANATCTLNAYHYEDYKCVYCKANIISIQVVDKEATGHVDKNNDGKCDSCGTAVERAAKTCSHLCHSKQPFTAFIWKIVRVFCKIFKINKYCSCGVAHY